jgi:hypothetical protein
MTDYAGFLEGFKLINELMAEVASVAKARGQMPDQHWARIAIRSVFALLEGFISRFKGRALEVKKYGGIAFSPKLLRILEEGQAVTREDGTIEWEHVRPRTMDNLKGSIRAFSSALETSTPLGGTVPLPAEFAVALAARNRVTHPKNLQDLVITEDEFAAVREILVWFREIAAWATAQEKRGLEELKAKVARDTDEMIAKIRREGGPDFS